MNRKLLALAIGAVMSLPFAANAAPTLYGQLNMSLDKIDIDGAQDQFEVNSNSSRLGVMGEEALGSGLSAVYKVEGVVDGDGDIGYDWDARDRYLGLKGNFGTVKLGNYDSPLKSSQGAVDQFNDMRYLDMGNVLYGENRMANLIGYESPKIADAVTVKVALQPGEDSSSGSGSDGIADVMSASVAFENNTVYLAAAIDQGDGVGLKAGTDRDTLRLTGVVKLDALQLGAVLQDSQLSDGPVDQEQQAFLVSAAFTAGKNVFKGQVISSTEEYAAEDEEVLLLAVGVDHNFTQMTKVYGQVGMGSVDNFAGTAGDDRDMSVLTVGMLTKF